MPKKKTNSGFSLMEILVSLAIFMLVNVLVYNFIVQSFKSTTFNEEQEVAVQEARRAMANMTKEIRGANTSEQGDYPLNTMEIQEIIFYSDVDEDGLMERVRYFKDDLLLKKEITEPGTLYDYSDSPVTTTIAQFVNNQEEALFLYYDSNHNTTTAINEVRLISIILKINVTPERAPNDYYVETDVSFRNLKSNL